MNGILILDYKNKNIKIGENEFDFKMIVYKCTCKYCNSEFDSIVKSKICSKCIDKL